MHIFEEKNAWYFRNALVLAKYMKPQKDIYKTAEYLGIFFLELKSPGASKFLSSLVQADIIESVSCHRKEKYKFKA